MKVIQVWIDKGSGFRQMLFDGTEEDKRKIVELVKEALKKAGMGIDVNTGTFYRYPIAEISPYPDFMRIAAEYGLPIITSSDSHKPEDCGSYIDDAIEYVKGFGYTEGMIFDQRRRMMVPLG